MQIIKPLAAVALVAQLTGCAAYLGMDQGGILYRDVTMPLTATQQGPGTKVGRASASSILGLINTGNAGIQAAKQAGGITRVSHVEYQSTNILGIIGSYTVIVYGD